MIYLKYTCTCLYLPISSAFCHVRSCCLIQIFNQVRNEKARRYLSSMRKKRQIPLSQKFPNADPLALRLLERMLAFEPKDRPTAEEVNV